MPEPHDRTYLDQSRFLGRDDGVGTNAKPANRPPEQRGVAEWLRSSGQQ